MRFIKSRKHVDHGNLRGGTVAAFVMTALVQSVPLAVSAQTTSDKVANQAAQTLPGVTVTADGDGAYRGAMSSPKFTQPLLDTPQTVQIVTDELIDEQAATTLTEALRNSPGVSTFYAGENGNTSTGDDIYMRGFDASGSIFVDGVRDLGAVSRDLFNVEQVEVTKGPDGTEYGRTAPAGAINMVTKQPFMERRVDATLALGTASRKRATVDWNQPIGGTSALRLNLMGQDSGVPGRDRVENDRWGVAPSLAFGLGTDTRVFLDYLHVTQNNVPDGRVPTVGLPGYSSPDPSRPWLSDAAEVDSDNFYGTDKDYEDVDVDRFTVRVEHDFGNNVTLRNTSRWGRTKQDYLISAFMANTSRFNTPDIHRPDTWTIERLANFRNQKNTILTNQTNLQASFDTGAVEHDLSVGLEFTREEVESTDMGVTSSGDWATVNLYHPSSATHGFDFGSTGAGGKGHVNTYAAYLFDTLTFNPQWKMTAGVRLDHYQADYSATSPCGTGRRAPDCGALPAGTPVGTVDASGSDTLLSWKLGVVYKPVPNGSLYANYAVAWQPPGGESLTFSSSSRSADNPALEARKARTIEIGTKWDLFDQRLLLSASLYRTMVNNQVEQDPVDMQYYQTGEKRVQGIELSAIGHITDAWAVSAGYTTMDAEITDGSPEANDGSDALAYTPDEAFTLWTSYEFANGITLAGGTRYNGSLKRGRDGAVGTPESIDGYWVTDVMARYQVNPNFALQLNIDNLFDKDYVAAINKSGYRYTPGAPRSAMLTANLTF